MRVLMLSQFYPPVIGGEERHVVSLSESLARLGHEVSVATQPHHRREPVLRENGVTVHSIGGLSQRAKSLFTDDERRHVPPFPDPEIVTKLARIVADFEPDIVHGHNWMLHSFLPLKRFSKAAFVATIHDYSLVCAKKNLMHGEEVCSGPGLVKCLPCASTQYGPAVAAITVLGNFASTLFERRAVDRFITVSQAVADYCGIADGKVPYEVLPTFIPDSVADLVPADEWVALLPEGDFMLFVGDLNRRKGVHVLLDAYRRLANPPPLVMIGRRCPDMPDVLPPGVSVFEKWPHAAVMHAWSRCLFGIAPSVWAEACGTIVMEGNAVGKAMIASAIGGLADLVVDGRTGIQVPAGQPGALAQAMRVLIEDGERREAMGRAARLHVERFMAKTIVPRIERLYEDALRDRGQTASDPMSVHVEANGR